MTDEADTVEQVSKEACRHAKSMLFEGSVPTYLGINGMLALMHMQIKEYIDDPNREALLSLVAFGIHALSLKEDEEEWDDLTEDGTENTEEFIDEKRTFEAGPDTEDIDHPMAASYAAPSAEDMDDVVENSSRSYEPPDADEVPHDPQTEIDAVRGGVVLPNKDNMMPPPGESSAPTMDPTELP